MKDIKLHPVTKPKNRRLHNRWCGPGALSILTGMNTQQASRLLRHFTGQTRITSCTTSGLLKALKSCGIEARSFVQMEGGCTLNQLRRHLMIHGLLRGRTFLVIAGNHFQILQDDLFADNQVNGAIRFKDLKRGKRRRVEEVFELTAPNLVGIPVQITDRAKPTWQHCQRKCIRLAKKLGVSIETDGCWRGSAETIWTWCEDGEEPASWDDNHFVHGWEECLHRLEEFALWKSQRENATAAE